VVALLSQGPSRVFISNQAAVERVPDIFNLPLLSILFFVDSPALLREKAARGTARRSLGRTTRLGRPNNLALPSHPDSLQISRKHPAINTLATALGADDSGAPNMGPMKNHQKARTTQVFIVRSSPPFFIIRPPRHNKKLAWTRSQIFFDEHRSRPGRQRAE
jgi:hypothetical protein